MCIVTVDAASVNFEIAIAVLEQAVKEGVARAKMPDTPEARRKWAEEKKWEPKYPELKYSKDGIA